MIYNSHAHLTTKNINPELTMVVATNKSNWQELSKFKYLALGIHPWFINNHTINDISLLENNIKKLKPQAIGEIGLDFHNNILKTINKEEQIYFFESQLKLAEKYNLPVIIHSVKSYDEIYNILKKYNLKIQIHNFNSSIQQSKKLLNLDCYLSFGYYKKSLKLQKVIINTPLDKILIETDEKDNNLLIKVANEIAKIKNITTKKLININNNNFNYLFCP